MKNTNKNSLSISGLCLILLTVLFSVSQAYAEAPTAADKRLMTLPTNFDLSSVLRLNDSAAFNTAPTVFSAFLDPLQSSSIVVNTLADGDAGACNEANCTLREAVKYAPAGATISFSVTGIIQLVGSDDLAINKNLTINGPGADSLTVKAAVGYGVGVFDISGGIVSISGLKLSDGSGNGIWGYNPATGLDGWQYFGGAIYISGGTATLTNCTLSNNSAEYGGAIYVNGGSLAVTGSTISNNNIGTGGYGGGIYVRDGSLAVASSTISGNVAGWGGGLYISGGTATIESSAISGNTAKNYTEQSTFICNYPACPNPPPTGYTCSGTQCTGYSSSNGRGGGIINTGGTVTVTNSTISGNIAQGYSTAVDYGGGGIENRSTATIANSTVTNNSGYYGGGIQNRGTLNLSNSIVAGNSALIVAGNSASESGSDIFNFPVGIISGNYNLVQNGNTPTGTNNITGQPALLGALANNGGPTRTHALLLGSPAFDAGDPNFDQANTPFDQRGPGFPRVVGGRVDIGAYESAPPQNGSSFIVNTLADGDAGLCSTSVCTLREAVKYAPAGATITFSVTGTITLTKGELPIAKNLTIIGPASAPGITVSGNGASRIFTISSGTINFSTLSLSGGNGVGSVSSGSGGAIYISGGTVTLSNSSLSGNSSTFGGAIDNRGGVVTVANSTFSGNRATSGGAIRSFATLTVNNSTFSGNSVSGTGSSASGTGGAIRSSGTLTIANSTFSGNSASITGGGIYLNANSSGVSTPLNLSNSILASNSAPTGPDLFGTVASGDYNLVQNTSGATLSGTHNITGQPALLGSLGDNGGPTQTHALLSGSPAINAGDPNFDTANTPFDQRGSGYARKGGSAIDIGALEEQTQGSTTATAINSQPQNQTVCESASANFSVGASGESLTYQWRKDGANLTDGGAIFGATTANLMINSAATSSAGSYDVVVSGANGTQTSSAATLAVNSAPAITNQPADQNVNSGASASFTAAANGAQGVQWQVSTDNGASFGDISGATAGTLTLSAVTSTQNGNKYRAVFSGACGNPATSGAATLTVGKLAQTITFNAIADKTYGDAPFALTASSSSNLPIAFTVVSGAATISSNNMLTINGAGSVTIRAAQAGDNQYNAAPSVDRSFTVNKATPVVTWSNPADITYGTKLGASQLNATASVAGSFVYNPAANTLLNAGLNQSLSVNFTPDDANNYATAEKSVKINVSKANQTITFASLGAKTFGDADLTVSASSDSGLTVSFAATAGGNCSMVNGNTVHITGAGSCEITASQAGNDNYNAATSVARSFTINQATQTINFGALSGKFIGNGGIAVSATGGASGNPVTFASSTTSVCTSGGTNGAAITFVGLGTCTINASQTGSGNYSAANNVSQSFNVNADPTTITLDLSGHSLIDFDCAKNVIAATVKDQITGLAVSGATVTFSIGTQSVTATTDSSGVASAAIVLNQPTGTVQASASYAGGGIHLPQSVSQQATIGGSPSVGPGQNATSLYTGSLYFWTTGSTSNTATLTLSSTVKDTSANCAGDITKAKVSFYISTGGSFSPVSGAQNLPVGLVNPTDSSVGTASAISQYNIGNNQSVTLTVRVVVSGQYTLNTTTYDQLITIGKPGQANSLMGGGQISNDGNPFPANGYLGLNSINSSFGSQVAYNKSGTNPQGQVQVYIRSCNNSDGTVDSNCDAGKPETHHVYFIKSNSISELSSVNGTASFGSKTNVSEVLANGSKVGLDGGGTMQIVFTPYQKQIPKDMYVGSNATCSNQQGCMSITAYKSSGGVWYSSSWGQGAGTTAPHTYVKNVLPGGTIAVQ